MLESNNEEEEDKADIALVSRFGVQAASRICTRLRLAPSFPTALCYLGGGHTRHEDVESRMSPSIQRVLKFSVGKANQSMQTFATL